MSGHVAIVCPVLAQAKTPAACAHCSACGALCGLSTESAQLLLVTPDAFVVCGACWQAKGWHRTVPSFRIPKSALAAAERN